MYCLYYHYCMLGYVALKRPNEVETVAYQLTVCNSLLSTVRTYRLNRVCMCVCVCVRTCVRYTYVRIHLFLAHRHCCLQLIP